MKIRDAILKSLEELNRVADSREIYQHIVENGYIDFGSSKTPENTVSSELGWFNRNGDTRVQRIKRGRWYSYYLTKQEEDIDLELEESSPQESNDIDVVEVEVSVKPGRRAKKTNNTTYQERDLHKLLSTYLRHTKVLSKTIFHEQSTKGKEHQLIWTHPDMIGIRFLNLQSPISQNFIKTVNRVDTFRLSSYELKKEINNDADLKKAYFQAVSNSSWANYGYLVALEIKSGLFEEMERLNQSFGIGIIEIKANPFQSRVLFSAKYKDLDFKTIDKLCKANKEFGDFIEHVEKFLTASDRYYVNMAEKQLAEFCDDFLVDDDEIEAYCLQKLIPLDSLAESEESFS